MSHREDLEALADRVEKLSASLNCEARPYGESYAVTEHGDIWSCRRGAWVKMKPKVTDRGYLIAALIIEGAPKSVRVNRIIAEAFHGTQPFEGALARHLDDDRAHNHYSNIAWGSHSDNGKDAVRNGRSSAAANSRSSRMKRTGDNSPARKLSADQVRQIRARLTDGAVGTHLALEYSVSKYAISLIKRGKSWKSI